MEDQHEYSTNVQLLRILSSIIVTEIQMVTICKTLSARSKSVTFVLLLGSAAFYIFFPNDHTGEVRYFFRMSVKRL